MQAIDHLKQQVLAAANARRTLRIRGGGTKDWYGQQLEGEILDTRACSGIVDYSPTELVITARCGTPLVEIEAALAEHRQMLAFEPPHFGAGATLGGVIASGLSGPRRQSAGAVRDFVLGSVLMDGRGEILTFGGQVMKNVAGYDVSRLLAGSLGTLGIMLQHSVKVLPRAFSQRTLRLALDQSTALRRMNEWGGKPLPISASCWHDARLTLRLSGARAAVDAAAAALGGAAVDDCQSFWASLRDQRHAFFAGGASLWRLSVPSTAGTIALPGEQLIEWGGAQRWLKLRADAGDAATMATNIRRAVAAVGGHATLFRGGDKSVGVFHPLAPGIARIHERLKAEFDPSHIFNPGRTY
jgi:glycolate oxidase FAD binding subunit